ncbi:hypothetical protein CEXT_371271 [Caerostris extrusa]|uniref:Uncharacterized protein n=1 Tax=Caerostris extrusa TaxID=172846 RepID=A0AAV4NQX1_CAEEX|nr:hypothetical protein CEXT_371271 [Caerostris extrusa]
MQKFSRTSIAVLVWNGILISELTLNAEYTLWTGDERVPRLISLMKTNCVVTRYIKPFQTGHKNQNSNQLGLPMLNGVKSCAGIGPRKFDL